jgi:hypothetical protein
MLDTNYLAVAAAGAAGILQLVQSKPWPLTGELFWSVLRAMIIAAVLVWLFASIYNHLVLNA